MGIISVAHHRSYKKNLCKSGGPGGGGKIKIGWGHPDTKAGKRGSLGAQLMAPEGKPKG